MSQERETPCSGSSTETYYVMNTQNVLFRIFVTYCCSLSVFGCGTVAPKTENAELRTAYAIHQPNLTCDQANQFSYRVVERLGYTIRAFSPAKPGVPGTVNGVRASELGEEPVSVQITCAADGVHVDANAESPLDIAAENALPLSSTHTVSQGKISGVAPARVYFRRAFYAYFMGRMEAAARGESPTPQGQMQIKLTPITGMEATLEFGKPIVNLFTVRVEISNTTTRAYVVEVDKIVVFTPEGKRVPPVSADTAALPVPPLATQQLAPGARLKGYLYYPPGSYRSARGGMIEKESQEHEGFDIQF